MLYTTSYTNFIFVFISIFIKQSYPTEDRTNINAHAVNAKSFTLYIILLKTGAVVNSTERKSNDYSDTLAICVAYILGFSTYTDWFFFRRL